MTPKFRISQACPSECECSAIPQLRAAVERVSNAFAQEVGLTKFMSAGSHRHLEHMHVYFKGVEVQGPDVVQERRLGEMELEMHVDAGMFLAAAKPLLLPASARSSLIVTLGSGEEEEVEMGSDTVLLMLGAQQNVGRAVPHAVQSTNGHHFG